MKDFERRLADLERAAIGERQIVILGPAEMTTEAALAELGIEPDEHDQVVYLCSFFRGGRPHLVRTVSGPAG